jgi:hypothetical protein
MNVNASYALRRRLDRLRGSVSPQRYTIVLVFPEAFEQVYRSSEPPAFAERHPDGRSAS